MNKNIFVFFLILFKVSAQIPDYTKAPNSYIFDKSIAKENNYGGIYVPVKKAYEMWAKYAYLKTNGVNTPIPEGVQSASVYWEDVPGIISGVSIVEGVTPSESKIKIDVNNALGNGNAVIALKVDGKIYWSWHIWVTDNPSNGDVYTQGFETDADNNLISVQYMDRNLGALSKNFLGNNWQKSGGLLYEWGRKDPFPSLVYKDLDFFEINSELGNLKHPEISTSTIPVVLRPSDAIEENIKYSVSNPLSYIINSDAGNWFSSSLYKVPGSGTSYVCWDLWSDNYKGGNGNANSSNTAIKADSRSYELKSELDPCPNGWRVPSYYGRVTTNNNLAPFGRKNSGGNDDTSAPLNSFYPESTNVVLDGTKVYPGLGMDFTLAQSGNRNLGIISNSGSYVYYPNVVAPNAPIGIEFQDQFSSSGLWSSTFAFDGARIFGIISDPLSTFTSVGKYSVYVNQTNPSKTGNAVKCMKDPNMLKIGNFQTEYFASSKNNFEEGLNNPNSYLITNEETLNIPVSKAFSVYNQLLSDHEMLPSDKLVAKVLWTTNPNIVTSIKIINNTGDPLQSYIQLVLEPGQKGNFVVSLHNGSTANSAYWSWHIWLPEGDPTQSTIKYISEQPIATTYNFVNSTKSLAPPLVTTFMDRNLGALNSFSLENTDSAYNAGTKGLLFQWGRKDALPSFSEIPDVESGQLENEIYLGSENQTDLDLIQYTKIRENDYLANFTDEFQNYNSTNSVKYKRVRDNLNHSVQNPLKFLYKQGLGQMFDGGNKASNNLSDVRDWISEDSSQATERWGHANSKSPFDPCPSGWRVPDVSLTSLYSGSKGNSPFYNSYKNDPYGNSGIIQDQWEGIQQYYSGNYNQNGWIFNDEAYPIGNFSADGIRGELGGNEYNNIRSGVWTASLADLHTGYALAMEFEAGRMQAGTGVFPQAAMSVRCAKDEERYLGVPITAKNNSLVLATSPTKSVNSKNLVAYPNPVSEELFVNASDAVFYEIYAMNGDLLQKGNLNNKISVRNLQKGAFFVKVNFKDGTSAYKKIIKN